MPARWRSRSAVRRCASTAVSLKTCTADGNGTDLVAPADIGRLGLERAARELAHGARHHGDRTRDPIADHPDRDDRDQRDRRRGVAR